jgi:hypothetical protein
MAEQFGTEDNATCMVMLHAFTTDILLFLILNNVLIFESGHSIKGLGRSDARLYQTPSRVQIIDYYYEF